MTPALELKDIDKRYGQTLANDGASIAVASGTVHAIVGENGAGKSTLMKVAYGQERADSGSLRIKGRQVALERHEPRAAIAAGLGMVHQHFMLVPTLTVTENVMLGAEHRRGPFLDRQRGAREVAALAARFGFGVDPDARIEDLSVGEQQRVEILKVLWRGCDVLILDEPTAVLTPGEVRELFAMLRALASEGTTIVLITHKLDEVLAIAEHITVMRRGKVIDTFVAASASPTELARAMVGREVLLRVDKPPAKPNGAVLRVQDLFVRSGGSARVRGVSFELCRNEILGVAGVAGNGQSELVLALAGLAPVSGGRVLLEGIDITRASVAERIAAGVAHVPEDRHARGVILEATMGENLLLGQHRRFASRWGLDRAAMRAHAEQLVADYDIRPTALDTPVRALSGGNQQKLVMARALTQPGARILLCAQPTRGVDVGAIEALHQRLIAARDAGLAVLLVSAELAELEALADRVMVMYGGAVVATLDAAELAAEDARERIGAWMTGAGGRGMSALRRQVYTVAIALLVAMACGSILILIVGQSPARVYTLLLARTWGEAYGIGQVLFKATPLVFTGLAVAVAFRVGLFNIGAEGQMVVGAFAAAVVGAALPAQTPGVVALPLCLASALAAGALLGAIPGVLKAAFGAHEVINTIMLNFIAAAMVLWAGNTWFFASESTHTATVATGAQLPSLGLPGSAANWSVALAAVAAAGVWYFFARTRRGREWRAVGMAAEAAETAGISRARATVGAMAAAGAIAGLAGVGAVLGYKHYYEDGVARGAGFMGIAVALLGRNHPLGVVLAALLFGTLAHGGLAVAALVPKEIVDILEGVIILAVVATAAQVRRHWGPR